jgi:Mn-containing catalase
MSQGDGDMRGPWNSDENFTYISERGEQVAVDGGDGLAQVKLSKAEITALQAMVARTASDPQSDPVTGAELGDINLEQ